MKYIVEYETENGGSGYVDVSKIDAMGSYSYCENDGTHYITWIGSYIIVNGVKILSKTPIDKLWHNYRSMLATKNNHKHQKKKAKEEAESKQKELKKMSKIKEESIDPSIAKSFSEWLNSSISLDLPEVYTVKTITKNALSRNNIYVWGQLYLKSAKEISQMRYISYHSAELLVDIINRMKDYYK